VAITSVRDVDLGKPFVGPDGELWEVQSYCEIPTVTMINKRTGQRMGGGVGCLNLQPFVPLVKDCPDGLLAVGDEKGEA